MEEHFISFLPLIAREKWEDDFFLHSLLKLLSSGAMRLINLWRETRQTT
jgi:hypothetical protein